MSSCKDVRRMLPQFVADGEPRDPAYASLREHVATCKHCAAQTEYLRAVETALRTMPRALPSPRLHHVLLEQALEEHRLRQAGRSGVAGQLGWDVLAPLLTLVVALMITAQFLPADVWEAARQTASQVSTLHDPMPATEFLGGQAVSSGPLIFWAMWIATAVVLCGFGLAWALTAWTDDNEQQLDDIQTDVRKVAERLLNRL